MMRSLIYTVLWQGAWFAGVYGAAAGNSWLGPLTALPAVLFALWGRGHLVRPLVIALLSSVVVDGLLGLSGLCGYALGGLDGRLPAAWTLTLWVLYALAFDSSLRWSLVCRWLAVTLAVVGAPAAYLGGVAIGALTMPHGKMLGALAVGIGFGVATLALAHAYKAIGNKTKPVEALPETAP